MKDDDKLYWPELSCKIYNPGNGNENNELT